MIKAAHQESWDAYIYIYISNIENDVHGRQLNAYKILKHLNKDQKDSADIQVINEVKRLEYFTRQWSKKMIY
jgi:hypothetical protein